MKRWLLTILLVLLAFAPAAMAQPIDLSHGGPITITAQDGMEWRQNEQEVIARGQAVAIRGNVTVDADRLIAFYRKKAPAPGAPVQPVAAQSKTPAPASGTAADPLDSTDNGGNEIYRLRAEGHVQIYTPTDHAQGDLAVYDIDQSVLVLTGHDLKVTTPNDVLTARDSMEYWSQKHMAVARGDAVVVTKDARRVAADVLVAYTSDTNNTPAQPGAPAKPTPPPPTPQNTSQNPNNQGDDLTQSGKLEKVDAFGHVSIRTPTDIATGERAVYVPDSGIARIAGNVQITRGQNQLKGQEAEVNMKTGIARLLRGNDARVTGLIVPNDASNQSLPGSVPPPATTTPTPTPPSGAPKPTAKSSPPK